MENKFSSNLKVERMCEIKVTKISKFAFQLYLK